VVSDSCWLLTETTIYYCYIIIIIAILYNNNYDDMNHINMLPTATAAQ